MNAITESRRTMILTALVVICFCGCKRSRSPVVDSHDQMVRLLAEIREQAKVEDEYFEDASVRIGTIDLEAMQSDSAAEERLELQWNLGVALLRVGRNQEATERLRAAYELLPEAEGALSEEQHRLLLQDLALGYLRQGEAENCLFCETGESCILPIRGGGVHNKRAGSEQAIGVLEELLKRDPEHLTARWLLNLAHMTLGQYPESVPEEFRLPTTAFKDDDSFPRFRDVSLSLGLKSVDCSGSVVADDFDNDGLIDLVTSTWDRGGALKYYRNNGDGTWAERGREAGFGPIYGGLNLIQGDYDNDGDPDLYVLRGAWLEGQWAKHPNSLLQNDGQGNFRDVTFAVGLGDEHFPTQTAAWSDFDNDGDLDLYVGNEKTHSQLFRNDGKRFVDIAAQAGVTNDHFAKGVIWGDYDNDRFPDLYVSNLGQPNRLYRNNRDGTFTDVAENVGVQGPRLSFPVWFWDFNNDGVLDLYVPGYEVGVKFVAADYLGLPERGEQDCLYAGLGDGAFRDVALQAGLTVTNQPMGCNFGDLDNDGFLDFYLGTGYPGYQGLMPNLMFKNERGGEFRNVTYAGGFGHIQKGHGIAFVDWDQDGDQDVFAQMGGAYPGDAFGNVLFENPGFDNHWLVVRLEGKTSNRSGIGARIKVDIREGGEARSIYRWVNSGGSFGANPLRQHIGVGKATAIEAIEIYWPTSDSTQRFTNVPMDGMITVQEGSDQFRKDPYQPVKAKHDPS